MKKLLYNDIETDLYTSIYSTLVTKKVAKKGIKPKYSTDFENIPLQQTLAEK